MTEENNGHEDVLKIKGDDPTERLGQRSGNHGAGHVIHFVHVPTNSTVHFKAFLTSWEDSFKQTWKSTETVGRMDPIMIYSRTGRQISFGFDIPSYNSEEAAFNLLQVQKLIQMSYPTFETVNLKTGELIPINTGTSTSQGGTDNAIATATIGSEQKCENIVKSISTMISPPFFRIKFNNWLNNPSLDPSMTARDANDSGLYGTLENVKFTPDLSSDGGFYGSSDLDQTNESRNVLIPKLLKLELMFTVLHTNMLGYDNTSKQVRTYDFPYNARKMYNKIKVT